VCSSSRRATPACSDQSLAGIPNWGIQNCWRSELGAQSGRKNQPACLSVSNIAQNFFTDLHEIFREGLQWAIEQMIKF